MCRASGCYESANPRVVRQKPLQLRLLLRWLPGGWELARRSLGAQSVMLESPNSRVSSQRFDRRSLRRPAVNKLGSSSQSGWAPPVPVKERRKSAMLPFLPGKKLKTRPQKFSALFTGVSHGRILQWRQGGVPIRPGKGFSPGGPITVRRDGGHSAR